MAHPGNAHPDLLQSTTQSRLAKLFTFALMFCLRGCAAAPLNAGGLPSASMTPARASLLQGGSIERNGLGAVLVSGDRQQTPILADHEARSCDFGLTKDPASRTSARDSQCARAEQLIQEQRDADCEIHAWPERPASRLVFVEARPSPAKLRDDQYQQILGFKHGDRDDGVVVSRTTKVNTLSSVSFHSKRASHCRALSDHRRGFSHRRPGLGRPRRLKTSPMTFSNSKRLLDPPRHHRLSDPASLQMSLNSQTEESS
jgi:hypothetical protein